MGVSYTYCNYFTVYANQTIVLSSLNLHSDVCQLFLNKTEKKKNMSGNRDLLAYFCFSSGDKSEWAISCIT